MLWLDLTSASQACGTGTGTNPFQWVCCHHPLSRLPGLSHNRCSTQLYERWSTGHLFWGCNTYLTWQTLDETKLFTSSAWQTPHAFIKWYSDVDTNNRHSAKKKEHPKPAQLLYILISSPEMTKVSALGELILSLPHEPLPDTFPLTRPRLPGPV